MKPMLFWSWMGLKNLGFDIPNDITQGSKIAHIMVGLNIFVQKIHVTMY